VLWSADWRLQTGTSQAALTQGGVWTFLSTDAARNAEVVPNTAELGFPPSMSNVLKVASDGTRDAWIETRIRGLPIPEVGESRFLRFYIRNVQPDGLQDYGTHPIQDVDVSAASSQVNWSFNINDSTGAGLSAGEWSIVFITVNGVFNDTRWYLGNGWNDLVRLSKSKTYRVELEVRRASDATILLKPRVFDEAVSLTVPLHSEADFHKVDGSKNLGGDHPQQIRTLGNLGGVTAGCNGFSNAAAPHGWPLVYGYQGGFCIRADTWCGPYAGAWWPGSFQYGGGGHRLEPVRVRRTGHSGRPSPSRKSPEASCLP
jgi:hypothetical protein